jgi:hypothetical protein
MSNLERAIGGYGLTSSTFIALPPRSDDLCASLGIDICMIVRTRRTAVSFPPIIPNRTAEFNNEMPLSG